MMKLKLMLFCLFLAGGLFAQILPADGLYGTGSWDSDSLGNHRAVVEVKGKITDAVIADIPWRLRVLHPENNQICVIDAATGKRITNVNKIMADRERCEVVFQPATVPGKYYIYYLKTVGSRTAWYQKLTYDPYVSTADAAWLRKNKLTGKKSSSLPVARLVKFESINEFNSFYPMEVIATKAETDLLVKEQGTSAIIFTEDRAFPIRMTTDIPYKWIADKRHDYFNGTAKRGEFYTFQVGVWAVKQAVKDLKITFSDLTDISTGAKIPASAFSSFNTEGVDVTGSAFRKSCDVEKGKVQALWIGAQVNTQMKPGKYTGRFSVAGEGMETKNISLEITVSEDIIEACGDNEPWRHSRLRWLNSQLGHDDEVVAPFTVLARNGNTISCLGRTLTISPVGLPAQITSYFKEELTGIGTVGRDLLASPISFVVDGKSGVWENLNFEYTKQKHGVIAWKALNQNNAFIMNLEAAMEFDGNIEYKLTLVAREDIKVNDMRLETILNKGIAKYLMGLGEKGGYCPEELSWKWNVRRNQDGPWIGDVNAGMQLRLFDHTYDRPLNTNFYQDKPLLMPDAWFNGGKGGMKINKTTTGTAVTSYSGERMIRKGEVLKFYFNIAVTPFKPVDTQKQWTNRYYHSYEFIDKIEKYGGTVINIHHANEINPFINYPFLRPNAMKAYIDGAHAKNMKVKIYNTVRELSNSATEIFALRSLGNEIFSKGPGGGYSWLQEHLDQNYIAAWYASNYRDAAVVNSGVSRWHNYYVEGLNWLVKNVGIDGLYIDDLAFDRMTMKRARKVLTAGNPAAMIDLHSANQYNEKDGFANSANLYMEHMPYIDRLWFGEYFNYDFPPEFWMVEVSGLPYGIMGEMLQDGGNAWRGMLFGMTARAPRENVSTIWKVWDSFGIDKSEMIGYWVKSNPVKTNSEKTLATAYVRKGEKTLISIATWEDKDAAVQLSVDWNALGLDPAKVTLHAPEMEAFQSENTWKPGDTITVPKGKGYLIIVE